MIKSRSRRGFFRSTISSVCRLGRKTGNLGYGAWVSSIAGMTLILVAMGELGVHPWPNHDRPPGEAAQGAPVQHNPESVAKAFTGATTLKERLKWIRDPDRVEPWVHRFYQTGAGERERLLRYQPLPVSQCDNGTISHFEAIMRDGERRLVLIVDTPTGPKVDFETYSRHCETPWEDLLSGRVPKSGAMRVLLRPDNFFNRHFPDDGTWFSIAGESPDLGEMLHLYASVTLPRIRTFMNQGAKHPLRATVRLASHDGSHFYRELEITELIAEDWVVP